MNRDKTLDYGPSEALESPAGRRRLVVDEDAAMDIRNITTGVFAPLTGFLSRRDYRSVVDELRLPAGQPWTIPITLDVPESELGRVKRSERLHLVDSLGRDLASLEVEGVFTVDLPSDIKKVYGTTRMGHPGVAKEFRRSRHRVAGTLKPPRATTKGAPLQIGVQAARRHIARRGWKTVVGFQTRNAPHRAHEYLQRVSLELFDGLFIHPLIGWTKEGDFTPKAVALAYRKLIALCYPPGRILFGLFQTAMRYAGPREAVFHALVRKNFGCTHFIIGRDHAGVGNFYGKYAAHQLSELIPDLGIEIIRMRGPYYCKSCRQIVTERTCRHEESDALHISGTRVRQLISAGEHPPEEFMRREIADILISLDRANEAFNLRAP